MLPTVPTEDEETVYERPRVEAVLTPEELTREVLYAGRESTDFVEN